MIYIPDYETICTLSKAGAIKAISNTSSVMYRHGVWNEYYQRNTDEVIESIARSGYGADVRKDKKTGVLYVSIPCDSDMW